MTPRQYNIELHCHFCNGEYLFRSLHLIRAVLARHGKQFNELAVCGKSLKIHVHLLRWPLRFSRLASWPLPGWQTLPSRFLLGAKQ